MTTIEYAQFVHDETHTERLAAQFAKCIVPGLTVSLNATLGAGKTRFAQAFSSACGIPDGAVVSPTYVICQEYQGDRFQIHHLDVYRLESDEEFLDLGSDELFESDSVKLIEWGEQVVDCLPDDRLEISIVVTGETTRTFLFRSTGSNSAAVVECLHQNDPQLIYKIVPAELWAEATAGGSFHGAPIDIQDGFIHFSADHQVAATAAKHFAGQSDLQLVAVNASGLGSDLKWEMSRGGDLFPHLYGSLTVTRAESVVSLKEGLARLGNA